MQIGQTTSYGITAPTGSSAVASTAPESATAQTSTASATPLSGGQRTISFGLFNEAGTEETTRSSSSFADIVAHKTQDFSKTLKAALESAKIPTDEPMTFTIDAGGKVSVDSPYKKRIEEFFEDNPELAKQLKDIAALNSMVALNEAMRRYGELKDKAKDDDERKQADAAYAADTLTIQSLSGTMTLEGGQLTSAAVSYMSPSA